MRRKLVRQGGGALTVTLPSAWCAKNRLAPGDEVDIDEDKSGLIVHAGKKPIKTSKETTIHLTTKSPRMARSVLGALYRRGYDRIRVRYDDEGIFPAVKEATNSIIGYDITDKRPGQCTVQSFLEEGEADFQATVNKLINTTKTLQTICREDYVSGRHARHDEVQEYRTNAWKQRDYLMRLAVRRTSMDDEAYALTLITWVLEKINKYYENFYRHMKASKLRKSAQVLEYLDQVAQFYSDFADAIHKSELSKVERINDRYSVLSKQGLSLCSQAGGQAQLVMVLVTVVWLIQGVSSFLVTG